MVRLSPKAFNLLQVEVQRCAAATPAGSIQQSIALKRLKKLCQQPGSPATYNELWETVDDLFPDFDKAVVERAARANRPPAKLWGQLKWGAIALTTLTGGLWFVNLPYPMIRGPVARVAPILLLPSFMRMDQDYRAAIALTAQADQLVNQATSPADFDLGSTKVKDAQKHLDALPVWFLGYYPGAYCGWFGCSWRFTYDEFQQARQAVARMDASLFQEKNAQTQLSSANQTVDQAKQQFQAAPSESAKQVAIAQWQQGMDQLTEVPQTTLAGKTATLKLTAYQRDFQQVVGFTANNARSGNVIQAARAFAAKAQQLTPGNAPTVALSASQWEAGIKQWDQAIDRLQKIDDKDPDYKAAQTLLADYTTNQEQARIRLQSETDAVKTFQTAEQLQQDLVARASSLDENQLSSQLQAIESQLKKIPPGTTVTVESQTLLAAVQKRLK